MKALLLHPDRDFEPQSAPLESLKRFATDLGLEILLEAACGDDRYLSEVFSAALSSAWGNDARTIVHRQEVLGLREERGVRESIVRTGVRAVRAGPELELWTVWLAHVGHGFKLGQNAAKQSVDTQKNTRCVPLNAASFSSPGFTRLFETLERNLDDDYLQAATRDLDHLRFRAGILLSAHVGSGGKAKGAILRIPQPRDMNVALRALTLGSRRFTFKLDPRDLSGAQAFGELQDRGLVLIAEALWRSAHHVLGFLKALRTDLAFYVACLNLYDRLTAIGESVTWPELRAGSRGFTCQGLKDVCLSLAMKARTAGNDANAEAKPLVIVTGVNRGGKSTFLRSVGLAELLLHAGIFVTAEHFASSPHTGLFTHFKREEDRTMESGKFDEELARLGAMADHIRRGALVLFNESFAATNEREGAEIARQVTGALLDECVTVIYVSHMYDFTSSFVGRGDILFLRADRTEKGEDAFRLREGLPKSTSFGLDLYTQVFKEQSCVPAVATVGAPPPITR